MKMVLSRERYAAGALDSIGDVMKGLSADGEFSYSVDATPLVEGGLELNITATVIPKTPAEFIRLSPTECVRKSEIVAVRCFKDDAVHVVFLEARGAKDSSEVPFEKQEEAEALAKRLCDELAGVQS